MIGMPRMILTIVREIAASTRTPETRISAQIRPSTVETAREPMVTMIVSFTPISRMGRNSTDWARNRLIAARGRAASERSQAPLGEDLIHRSVRFQLGKRGVDLLEQFSVTFAHTDAARAENDGLVRFHQPPVREVSLLHVIGKDRIVAETRLQAAGVHVAHDVRDRVVDLNISEQAGLL